MKKFFTLCMSLLCLGMTAQAQELDNTFKFVEKQENGSYVEVPNGAVLNYTAHDMEETDWGTIQIKPALYVQNTTEDDAAMSLSIKINSLNEGAAIQCCAAGNCQQFSAVGEKTKQGFEAAGNIDDLMFEYIPAMDENEEYYLDGASQVVLQANVCEYTEETSKWGTVNYKFGEVTGYGPQITVNFDFNLTGIENVQNPDNGVVEEVARYNGAGQRVDAPVKGLNIVKLANGKTVKQIFK